MPRLVSAMGVAESAATAFDLFRAAVCRLRLAAAPPSSPQRFNAGDVLGRRGSFEDENKEEEAPRNWRHRSASTERDGRGLSRGCLVAIRRGPL